MDSHKPVKLQRNIGFLSSVGILVGTTIGSGIFITPTGVLIGCGSPGVTLIIWIICGFFSFLGALALAELGSLLPSSGGQYVYFLESFSPKRKQQRSFWGSLVPFLYNWQFTLLNKPALNSVKALACATYLIRLKSIACSVENQIDQTNFELKPLAVVIVVFITFINCYSVKLSTRVINLLTVTKLLSLFFIMVAGIYILATGKSKALKLGFQGTNWSYSGISLAFYNGLYAYGGWDNLNMVSGEMKNPKRDYLRTMVTGCSIITFFYVFANVAYLSVLNIDEFLSSEAVAVDVGDKLLGNSGIILMIVSVAFSIFGSTLGSSFTTVRTCYAAAIEGHLLECLCFLNIKYKTPFTALIFSGGISIMLIFGSNILGLISLTGFLDWAFMGLTMISLLVLRKTHKTGARAVHVPLIVPVSVFTFSLFLVVTPFFENPQVEYFFVLLFLLFGAIAYVPFVYYKKKTPGLDKMVIVIQKLFLVVPPEL